MKLSKAITDKIKHREESRINTKLFMKITELDRPQHNNWFALTTDISDHGLGLLMYRPLPVGTRVLVSFCGMEIAIGRVTDLIESWDNAQWCGIDRVGLQIVEKTCCWPLQ